MNTERVRVAERNTYSDPTDADPIKRANGELVEYVVLQPAQLVEGVAPTEVRVTVEAGINGEAAVGNVGTATLRAVSRQEAKIGRSGRPYIADVTKYYLAGFKAA